MVLKTGVPMGASYHPFILNDEMADWLKESNVPLSMPLPVSRFPTLGELKTIVERLDGYTTKVWKSKDDITFEVVDERGYDAGWSTSIWVTKLNDKSPPPNDGDIVKFHFHKGSPELAVLILEKLTHVCGPLVLTTDDGTPLLITAGLDACQAVEAWLY